MVTEKAAWNPEPDDPLLTADDAPHEPAAVLRAQRAGWRGEELAKIVSMKSWQAIAALERAITKETQAANQGRKIMGK